MKIYILADSRDVGSRDRDVRDLVGTVSAYGGAEHPAFLTKAAAEAFRLALVDASRFHVLALTVHQVYQGRL